MTRFSLLFAALLSIVMVAPVMAQTVVLVRHAERVSDGGSDPVLSQEGQARAQSLADRLSGSSVDLILTSPLQRTRLTAAPTAQDNGVEPQAIGFENGTEAHITDIVARVKTMPEDATILVVGHSNTVPLIARALGQATPDMPECEYDRLLTLRVQGQRVFGVTTRYGARSVC